jgi:hypothetical protein
MHMSLFPVTAEICSAAARIRRQRGSGRRRKPVAAEREARASWWLAAQQMTGTRMPDGPPTLLSSTLYAPGPGEVHFLRRVLRSMDLRRLSAGDELGRPRRSASSLLAKSASAFSRAVGIADGDHAAVAFSNPELARARAARCVLAVHVVRYTRGPVVTGRPERAPVFRQACASRPRLQLALRLADAKACAARGSNTLDAGRRPRRS